MTGKNGFINGMKPWEYWQNVRKKSAEKKKLKMASKQERLNKWFTYWVNKSLKKCENCNAPISFSDLRSCQAHILPKRDTQFPSVCDVIENHMTLGVRCGCHNKFDSSWENAAKMPIFPTAKERFKTFQHLIAPEEIRKIPEIFLVD